MEDSKIQREEEEAKRQQREETKRQQTEDISISQELRTIWENPLNQPRDRVRILQERLVREETKLQEIQQEQRRLAQQNILATAQNFLNRVANIEDPNIVLQAQLDQAINLSNEIKENRNPRDRLNLTKILNKLTVDIWSNLSDSDKKRINTQLTREDKASLDRILFMTPEENSSLINYKIPEQKSDEEYVHEDEQFVNLCGKNNIN